MICAWLSWTAAFTTSRFVRYTVSHTCPGTDSHTDARPDSQPGTKPDAQPDQEPNGKADAQPDAHLAHTSTFICARSVLAALNSCRACSQQRFCGGPITLLYHNPYTNITI